MPSVMQMKKMASVINKLRRIYGTHSDAARAMGISPRYYREARGRLMLKSPHLRILMGLLAEKDEEWDKIKFYRDWKK